MMVFKKQLVTAITISLISFNALAKAQMDCKVEDAVILKEIRGKISDPGIEVISEHCMVTLKGKVETSEKASTAIENAASTPGVLDVKTQDLVVANSEHPFTDAYITAKVKGAFIREKVFGDESISLSGIHVETKNSVVYLSGTANAEQLKNAINLTKAIKDVKGIESSVNTAQNDKEIKDN